MIVLQYVQSFFNFGASILGTISFTTMLTFIYNADFSCSNTGDCKMFRTVEADAAFSFAIILFPWIGCFLALMGKKTPAIIYAILIIAITACLLICSAIILADSDLKDIWRQTRDSDQYKLEAIQVNSMIIYNVAIAQIICIWFFLLGSAILTPLAAKKQEQEAK